jgi:hypothetical protein
LLSQNTVTKQHGFSNARNFQLALEAPSKAGCEALSLQIERAQNRGKSAKIDTLRGRLVKNEHRLEPYIS